MPLDNGFLVKFFFGTSFVGFSILTLYDNQNSLALQVPTMNLDVDLKKIEKLGEMRILLSSGLPSFLIYL
jgi:hypothetical protein